MDELTITPTLRAISQFEYLVAKKEYDKLISQIKYYESEGLKQNDIEALRFQLKKHDKQIKNMLHKSEEIEVALEGVYLCLCPRISPL